MLKEIKSDIYHLMHPKMEFFLTSISKEGKPNVMACAWATPVSEEPPMDEADIPLHLGGSRIVYAKKK